MKTHKKDTILKTIRNWLREWLSKSRIKKSCFGLRRRRKPSITSGISMFLKTMNRAMRYYRFWIYSCNVALLFATIIYMFAFIYVLNDTKMMLFPSIRLYQPTFLYSYSAIILQGGVLQVIINILFILYLNYTCFLCIADKNQVLSLNQFSDHSVIKNKSKYLYELQTQ